LPKGLFSTNNEKEGPKNYHCRKIGGHKILNFAKSGSNEGGKLCSNTVFGGENKSLFEFSQIFIGNDGNTVQYKETLRFLC
jgi:hypothetical protein